ncbi:hypothetical protein AR457_02290 [Streptomyces agglomeratus]|uniref:hypothetical protein n=1 Tax=Streptomyces agglomeratus TaxID=285458 RepID=UPI0008550BD7|nr:hypothetical protein [Streptomyces agglomeratus]OEJ43104.1 hypothetical protein AR457_02290 [Streptomyces agglomeratus]OEJ62349.1 hypothetical protein BGM19_34415 [Streptomyces agglomeratus]
MAHASAYRADRFVTRGKGTAVHQQQDGARSAPSDAPIYARLVMERGDVPTEVRRVAEAVLREADRAVDFGSVRPAVA